MEWALTKELENVSLYQQSRLTEKLKEERGVILEQGENPRYDYPAVLCKPRRKFFLGDWQFFHFSTYRAYFVKFQLFFEELNYEIIEEYLSYEVKIMKRIAVNDDDIDYYDYDTWLIFVICINNNGGKYMCSCDVH